MGLNDYDARWMLNKKKKHELSYNLQLAVDFETKNDFKLLIFHKVQQITTNQKTTLMELKTTQDTNQNPYHKDPFPI